MKARVHIVPKPGVLDPQGAAIAHALASLGFTQISQVRQGKVIDLEIGESDPRSAGAAVERACKQLLANSVTETFRIELSP